MVLLGCSGYSTVSQHTAALSFSSHFSSKILQFPCFRSYSYSQLVLLQLFVTSSTSMSAQFAQFAQFVSHMLLIILWLLLCHTHPPLTYGLLPLPLLLLLQHLPVLYATTPPTPPPTRLTAQGAAPAEHSCFSHSSHFSLLLC